MPTPTGDRPDLLTVVAFRKAAPGEEARLKALIQITGRQRIA